MPAVPDHSGVYIIPQGSVEKLSQDTETRALSSLIVSVCVCACSRVCVYRCVCPEPWTDHMICFVLIRTRQHGILAPSKSNVLNCEAVSYDPEWGLTSQEQSIIIYKMHLETSQSSI